MTATPRTPAVPAAGDRDSDTAAYNRELVERVEREAREATALPLWFWEAAAIILVVAIAASAAAPWGFAP